MRRYANIYKSSLRLALSLSLALSLNREKQDRFSSFTEGIFPFIHLIVRFLRTAKVHHLGMAQTELPPHPELPLPPAEKLNPHFILGEIRDYIRDFSKLFPFVDLDILFDQTTAVRRKNVDAEVQIRQFLKAFEKTSTFKDALEQLDPDTQHKVQAFSGGHSAHSVTKKSGFGLPASPATQHHFRLLGMFENLFHHHDEHGKQEAQAQTKDVRKPPVIYEDQDQKQVMKVCSLLTSSLLQCLTRHRGIQTSNLKTGASLSKTRRSIPLYQQRLSACRTW